MILGIDLGGTNVSIGLLKEKKLIKKLSAPSPADKNLQESLDILKNIIKPLVSTDVEALGIGVPSVVDVKNGIVYNVTNIPAWKEVPLKDILEKEFKIPVYINNDSNCFALGEKKFGKGTSYNNLVVITLGTGVGAGVIINNELYCGNNTGAGEIGCIKYLNGIYEDYCASGFFRDFYKTTGKKAAEKAQLGDEKSLEIWDIYGKHLGNLIQSTLFAYDPDAVILGGSISKAYKYFEKSLWENLNEFPYPESIKKLVIKTSQNDDIAILGAASLVQNWN